VSVDCPFCRPDRDRVLHDDRLVFVLRDGFPVSPGHVLVIPHRHVGSFFETTLEERRAILESLELAKHSVEQAHRPDGWTIGINDGAAAGQTVPHLHVHLIPRYDSDRPDPRGGVRWVLPDKADYWTKP
jgi:diadenosine tetraphosphate (Ap4A) HIT family hydrolase